MQKAHTDRFRWHGTVFARSSRHRLQNLAGHYPPFWVRKLDPEAFFLGHLRLPRCEIRTQRFEIRRNTKHFRPTNVRFQWFVLLDALETGCSVMPVLLVSKLVDELRSLVISTQHFFFPQPTIVLCTCSMYMYMYMYMYMCMYNMTRKALGNKERF